MNTSYDAGHIIMVIVFTIIIVSGISSFMTGATGVDIEEHNNQERAIQAQKEI